MGYYNPPQPHIGAQQPLEGRKLTPPSGPAPNNPPFRGSRVNQETLNSWAHAVTVAAVGVILPQLLVPQPAAAAKVPYNPARYDIIRAWDAPAPLPYELLVPRRLVPTSPPAPSNPPFMGGARVSVEVQINWLPPVLSPIVGPKFTSGSPPSYLPIGSAIPQSVLTAWLPPLPAPIVAVNLEPPISGPAPQNPPVIGPLGAGFPFVIAWWNLPPPMIVWRVFTPPVTPIPPVIVPTPSDRIVTVNPNPRTVVVQYANRMIIARETYERD